MVIFLRFLGAVAFVIAGCLMLVAISPKAAKAAEQKPLALCEQYCYSDAQKAAKPKPKEKKGGLNLNQIGF
jgi:hypothetical protein